MSLKPLTKKQIESITHVRIHPGIGVSRVGDSEEYFIGPEVKNPRKKIDSVVSARNETHVEDSHRDSSGAIKRQAARFRVYGYDKDGQVIAEIRHSSNSRINWTVDVANTKPEWFEFLGPMDLPEMKGVILNARNPDIQDPEDRALLGMKPGPKSIGGADTFGIDYQLTADFEIVDKDERHLNSVMLGELRTDEYGHLIFLPGLGKSESPASQPAFNPEEPKSFSNAAGWYDDVCDGPVSATVEIDGAIFQADPAWVISSPPNYAPSIVGWRTLNDLMQEVFITAGMIRLPEIISFRNHILPIFQRLTGLQWVNNAFSAFFGEGSQLNFYDEKLISNLARLPNKNQQGDPYQEYRRTIYNSFRPVNTLDADINSWPSIYGDTFGTTTPSGEPESARTYFELPKLFDYILRKWVDGDFLDDYEVSQPEMGSLADVPLKEQPDMLDQSAMHFCLADAFHPGCEITWPVRHASMYRAPYRIRQRNPKGPSPYYGMTITDEEILAFGGPLYEQGPGDLTRWMALPWQGDTAFCRSGYNEKYDPYAPAYWPARVPNSVLTEDEYNEVMRDDATIQQRLEAFLTRKTWYHIIPKDSPNNTMLWMVKNFRDMGILEERKGPQNIPGIPDTLYVEIGNNHTRNGLIRNLLESKKSKDFDTTLHRATGFHNRNHLEEFRDVRLGRKPR